MKGTHPYHVCVACSKFKVKFYSLINLINYKIYSYDICHTKNIVYSVSPMYTKGAQMAGCLYFGFFSKVNWAVLSALAGRLPFSISR